MFVKSLTPDENLFKARVVWDVLSKFLYEYDSWICLSYYFLKLYC